VIRDPYVNPDRIRGNPEEATESARELRQRSTSAEQVLWIRLRGRKLHGLKFRRQHPLGPYIVDFCCPSQKLIVEIDGEVHTYQREQDAARTEHLEQYGYRVIRFCNKDVFQNLDTVLRDIASAAGISETE
jgi:very-short-patch-repair endonuclease